MKKYLFLIIVMLSASTVFTQSQYEDVVYLKNGSIIRGVITEQIPNESIKIEISNGSIFVYRMDEIERIVREPVQVRSGGRDRTRNASDYEPGYEVSVDLGYQIGTGDWGLDRIKLDIINGYRINPYIFLGLGTGWRYYHQIEDALVPIFLNFKVNFIQSQMSPFLELSTGYSLNASRNFKGEGAFIAPTIGVDFPISDGTKMNVGLSYETQRLHRELYIYYLGDGPGYYERHPNSYNLIDFTGTTNSGAISLHIGFTF